MPEFYTNYLVTSSQPLYDIGIIGSVFPPDEENKTREIK